MDNLARQLVAAGQKVVILAPKPRRAHDDAQYPYPVVRYRRPLSKRHGVRLAIAKLATLHLRHRFDVLHCHATYPPGFVAATFRRWLGVPFVVRPHGSDILPGEQICKHPRLRARVASTLAEADGIIAQGRYLREVIEHLLPPRTSQDRLHTIHNGVNLSQFAQAPRPLDRPYLLSLGNLWPRKGFDLVLSAFAQLKTQHLDLVIAGEGPEGPALRRLADALGLSARVRFLGQVVGEAKAGWYRHAEAFVCASRREPFANVILEAQAAGLPVVATAVGGNTELVQHLRNGLLCPAEDVTALTAALNQLLHDRELAQRLRRNVPTMVQRFDWSAIAREYLTLYRQVVNTRGCQRTRAA